MTEETLHCIRGCTRYDRHLPGCAADDCPGCEPRQVETGWLCSRCLDRLHTLLGPADDRESVAGACAWLADNLGQHLSHSMGGKPSGDVSIYGEATVSVMAVMSDLQIGLAEFADDFTRSRGMQLRTGTHPAAIAARLRPWLTLIADWEPTADTIDHLSDLMRQAHAVAPWRGNDPGAGEAAAAVLYLAPAEATDEICARFGVTSAWLRKAKERRRIAPELEGVKPLRWKPWDVFRLLHPEDAARHEARLSKLSA